MTLRHDRLGIFDGVREKEKNKRKGKSRKSRCLVIARVFLPLLAWGRKKSGKRGVGRERVDGAIALHWVRVITPSKASRWPRRQRPESIQTLLSFSPRQLKRRKGWRRRHQRGWNAPLNILPLLSIHLYSFTMYNKCYMCVCTLLYVCVVLS